MLQSWHNFFFASFDPGGFITVDKPAFGLWIQTISAFIYSIWIKFNIGVNYGRHKKISQKSEKECC